MKMTKTLFFIFSAVCLAQPPVGVPGTLPPCKSGQYLLSTNGNLPGQVARLILSIECYVPPAPTPAPAPVFMPPPTAVDCKNTSTDKILAFIPIGGGKCLTLEILGPGETIASNPRQIIDPLNILAFFPTTPASPSIAVAKH